ncbi:MAG: hypothetical protein H6697_12800 [Myxococcales bacterium]|nr:hypothetical protein [Myxococcales bacterium]
MRVPALAVLVLLIAACDRSDASGVADAPTTEEFVRGLRFDASLMGLLFAEGEIDQVLSVERRFRLFEHEAGGDPVATLPECNTVAGRAGPCFFLSRVDPRDGTPFFDRPLWLEIEVRRPDAEDFVAMSPRCRLDPAAPMFGMVDSVRFVAGDIVARLPGLPMPTQAMLLDYPAGFLQGPNSLRVFSELLGESSDPAGMQAPERPAPRAFDSEAWRAPGRETERWDMLEDLLVSHEFAGLSRDELLALLGPPASPGFPFGAASWDVAYRVGSTFMDSFWLFVGFDAEGHVSRMRLYED